MIRAIKQHLSQSILLSLVVSLAFISTSQAKASLFGIEHQRQNSIAPMLKHVMPAVVNIATMGQLPAIPLSALPLPSNKKLPPNAMLQGPKFQDLGSGVILDSKKGYIVTNAHVLNHAKIIMVTLSDGRRFKAKPIGSDKQSDIAVIQIHANKLQQITLGDSDKLQVGDFVAAIGNPFGLSQTVTSGMVSALNRSNLNVESYEDFIQTDAPINPGNSGGALIDSNGDLIGINTAILSQSGGNIGIGFAIPSNMMNVIAKQLIKYGKIHRGILGVMVQQLTPALADAMGLGNTQGALVTQVSPDSPAAKAGIKAKDVIQQANGTTIRSPASLRNITGFSPVDSEIKLSILRSGKTIHVTAKIASLETMSATLAKLNLSFLSGVRLRDIDEMTSDGSLINGVLVIKSDFTSDAFINGLRPGDIILEANNKAVTNIRELRHAEKLNKHQLLLKIRRMQGDFYLVVT